MKSRNPTLTASFMRWFPLVILPSGVMILYNFLQPWAFMWSLAFSIYFGLKWFTWRTAQKRISHPAWRSVAYILAWPGMDADSFLDANSPVPVPRLRNWIWAVIETGLGVILIWAVAPSLPEGHPLLRGWAGMLGLILVLHFGMFQIAALFWQSLGVNAPPIMSAPLRSESLAEFWGKRWNLGFRQLAHDLLFAPLHKKLGGGVTSFSIFVVSGLIHDLVISVPARGGYGLPTGYFVLQGLGVLIERSRLGKQLGLREGVRGWVFMALFTGGPEFPDKIISPVTSGHGMTMQIKGLQIAGLPAIAVRKMLRRVHYLLDVDLVAASCELPTRMAKQVIQELVNDGYIEFAERSRVLAYPYTPGKEKPRYRWVDYYKLTDKGDKLTQASATNKMPRTKADRIIANFMKRVEEVNANADYMFRIPTVILYGSYVRGEPHLSDVDIAVDFEAKWDRGNTSQEEFLALTNKRVTVAQANGRVFSSFDGTLDWPRREVMLHLKARTKGLSIHELYDFIGMKKDSNFAYKVLLGDAPKIAEQIAKERSVPAESKAFSES